MKKKDIFNQLKSEHEEIKLLLNSIEECDPKDRKRKLQQIEQLLIPHARAEEKTFYALVLKRAKMQNEQELEDLANEAYEEHRVVDQIMSELKSMPEKDERWLALFKVAKENLEHHIEEEEQELFVDARSVLENDEPQLILDAYLVAYEKFGKSNPTQSQIKEREPSIETRSIL